MATHIVELNTQDGACHTEIITPDGSGPWPAILFCCDAGGQRPAMTQMAERIAGAGYLVAIPDFYYRVGSVLDLLPPGVPRDTSQLFAQFADPGFVKRWMMTYAASALDYAHIATDFGALLAHLGSRADVTGGVGTTGYCMGGNLSLRIASVLGDQITATAAFHPGGLVTPAPDSPHRRVDTIKSKVYIAAAIEDAGLTDDMKHELDVALGKAHVEHTIETYPARHGFAVSDNPTYDREQCERHFTALNKLFAPLASAPRPTA